MFRRSSPLLRLVPLAVALAACGPAAPTSSFALIYEEPDPIDPTGVREHAFTGESPSCTINTSYPEGDPERGKYFVSVFTENDEGALLSFLVHFMEHTAMPPAGAYANGGGASIQATFTNADGEATQEAFDGGSLTVAEREGGLRVELDASLEPLSGFVECYESVE